MQSTERGEEFQGNVSNVLLNPCQEELKLLCDNTQDRPSVPNKVLSDWINDAVKSPGLTAG